MDRIVLDHMEFYGYHGCLTEERAKGQEFYVDVNLALSLRRAGKSDELKNTVNYAAVFEIVKSIVEGQSYHLIEAVAERIAEAPLRAGELVALEHVVGGIERSLKLVFGVIEILVGRISKHTFIEEVVAACECNGNQD